MEEQVGNKSNRKRKVLAIVVFSIIAIMALITILLYRQYKKTHITTDDAFIEGDIHIISAKIPGTVKNIYVSDNEFVKKGELLVEVDAVDYEVGVREADSLLDAERADLSEKRTRVDVAKKQLLESSFNVKAAQAELEVQRANLRQADKDVQRAENLYKKDALSKEQHEKTMTRYDVAAAMVKTAEERLKQAEATIEKQKSIVTQAEMEVRSQEALVTHREASLRARELDISYTKITAPAEGYITKKSVQVGNQILPNQQIMAIVPLDNIWVVANYKETQLARVAPGQKVKIKVDTYPGEVFWGKVESIMSGSGAAFSLFPPENATGNYVKVVQRIPVKILLNKESNTEHRLKIGMSVVATILIEDN